MDTQNMVYPYKALLLISNKEQKTDTCNNMDETQTQDAKWKIIQIIHHIQIIWFNLHKMSRKEREYGVTANVQRDLCGVMEML